MLLRELLSFVFVFVFGRKYVAVFVFVSVSGRKWNFIFGPFSFSAENVKSVFGRSLLVGRPSQYVISHVLMVFFKIFDSWASALFKQDYVSCRVQTLASFAKRATWTSKWSTRSLSWHPKTVGLHRNRDRPLTVLPQKLLQSGYFSIFWKQFKKVLL